MTMHRLNATPPNHFAPDFCRFLFSTETMYHDALPSFSSSFVLFLTSLFISLFLSLSFSVFVFFFPVVLSVYRSSKSIHSHCSALSVLFVAVAVGVGRYICSFITVIFVVNAIWKDWKRTKLNMYEYCTQTKPPNFFSFYHTINLSDANTQLNNASFAKMNIELLIPLCESGST